jgi:ubiquinone/menaquinone biosynthesis C-methylase UbiE
MSQVTRAITDAEIQVEPIYKAQMDAFGLLDYPFLTKIINQNNIRRILDVGTGEGSFLIGLASKTESVTFDAIDLNEKLVEMAKLNSRQAGLSINFQHAVFGVNYPQSNYDLIMARFAIEHITEPKDIDSFIVTAHEKLKPNGWLVIIEYYVHVLDIDDPVWKRFRQSELSTYKSAQAHPRIALRLPESLKKANYRDISSTINHISPSTIGTESFFSLILEYTKLYTQVAPQLWTKEIKDSIVAWCNKKQPKGDPTVFTSYTIGRKVDS